MTKYAQKQKDGFIFVPNNFMANFRTFSSLRSSNHIALSLHFIPLGAHNSDYTESSLHFAFPNWLRQLRIVANVRRHIFEKFVFKMFLVGFKK